MNNREFLMLAKTFNPDKDDPSGWFCSIKYDGQRCFWDGGISRGKAKEEVPWANMEKDRSVHVCSGLWSRYGNVIHAPDSFLDALPIGIFLDGELYIDRGRFQETRSIISRHEPDSRWDQVRFLVFELPSPELIFQTGRINNPNFKKIINYEDCRRFYSMKIENRPSQFKDIVNEIPRSEIVQPVAQIKLPWNRRAALDQMYDFLNKETALGGEGLMLRHPDSYWDPSRTRFLLKVKPMEQDEGRVVGYTWGVGKYQGLMGALIVEWNGKQFNLSGFTDEERMMVDLSGNVAHEGVAYNPRFPLSHVVTFRYVSLTDGGIPREARYARPN